MMTTVQIVGPSPQVGKWSIVFKRITGQEGVATFDNEERAMSEWNSAQGSPEIACSTLYAPDGSKVAGGCPSMWPWILGGLVVVTGATLLVIKLVKKPKRKR